MNEWRKVKRALSERRPVGAAPSPRSVSDPSPFGPGAGLPQTN